MIIIVAALLLLYARGGTRLVLSNQDTGEEYLSLPVREGDSFSVTYIHSVHQTPVTEIYEVRGADIYVTGARFYTFGAGMQTDYPDGVSYTYGDDGSITVSGYNTLCTGMNYCVGMVSDHTLELGGEEYSLRGLCGRGTIVTFTIERQGTA